MGGTHRKRTRRPVTDSEYGKMMRRMTVAWQRRALTSPSAELADGYAAEAITQELAEQLRQVTNVAIYRAQIAGRSYGDIATELGMTKAAVIKRGRLGETLVRQLNGHGGQAAIAARIAQPRELPPATAPRASQAGQERDR
jgi:DNA-directed RNA polymerase specialized sigma24 family protein